MADRVVSVRLQAEIGQYVSGMTKAALSTKSVGESAAASGKRAGTAFSLAGKGAALLGLGAGAALAGIANKAMDFDKAMSGVQAATRASGAELAALRETAMKAGADTQYSATEAAGAITAMAKAGVSAKDIMGGGLNGALALAAAGQIDVADAAELASTAMTQFNLQGSDLPHVADLLAAGAGKAVGSVDDLGQALKQSGLVAAGAGLSIEETTGTLAAFAAAGLTGSDAGTSFKTMLQRLQAPVGDAAKLMDQLGISLYDANGQTLGLSEVAGQLHTALADMTPAARDNALAVMFGSDAVRAANVLYKDGAAGITEWTKKVDDAGYAQKQAADLTDNLSGDLERLGGSFDTLLITLGEGAQGPLRELVQMLGGIIDGTSDLIGVWKGLPGPVQAAAVAFGLWAVAGGKIMTTIAGLKTSAAGKAFDDLRLKMMYAKEEGEGLRGKIGAVGSAAGTAAGSGLKAFAGAIGPELLAAIAVGGVALLAEDFNKVADAGDAARAQVDEIADSLADMGNAGRMDATIASMRQLRDSLAEVQAVTAAKGGDQGFLANLIGPSAVIAGQGAAMKDAAESAKVYRDAIEELERKQRTTNDTASTLAGTFHMTQGEVIALADKYGIDLSGSVSESQRLFQNFYATEYGKKPTEATFALTDATVDAAAAIDAAKQAVDAYKLSLDILTGKTVSNIQVEAALEDSLDAAKDAVKDLDGSVKDANGSLNLHSEAGRAASDVLLDIRDSGNQLIATMIENGATTDEVTAKDKKLRESFIKSAQQMGFSKDEARKLADQILGIPAERETEIKADTKAAKDAITDVQGDIDGMHGRTLLINVRAHQSLEQQLGRTYFGQVAEFSADGNLYENHAAQIAPGGAMRVWAEPETGGEAYIPLAASKRPRSLDIWRETGRRLGVDVASYANGGVSGGSLPINVDVNDDGLASGIRGALDALAKKLEPATGMFGALKWARTQVGKPYIWGSAGPAGYDCSGFMSAITNFIRGRNPFSRLGSTATFPWSGFVPGIGSFTIGSTANAGDGIGHMAGTLLGVNVESRGGSGVHVGSSARGASDGLFGTRAHLAMANGGIIGEPVVGIGVSGRTYSFGERGPETVTPQSREFSGGRGGGAVTVNITGAKLTGTLDLGNGLEARMEAVVIDYANAEYNRAQY